MNNITRINADSEAVRGVNFKSQARRLNAGSLYPSAALQDKSPAQHANVHLRGHLTYALLRNKLLGEISGLVVGILKN